MNVVGHHDVRVQPIVPCSAVSVTNGTFHQFRNLGMAEVKRTSFEQCREDGPWQRKPFPKWLLRETRGSPEGFRGVAT